MSGLESCEANFLEGRRLMMKMSKCFCFIFCYVVWVFILICFYFRIELDSVVVDEMVSVGVQTYEPPRYQYSRFPLLRVHGDMSRVI